MSVPELFAPWFDSLAPGLGDPTRAATDRILYRSAADRAAGEASPADAMDVEGSASPPNSRRAAERQGLSVDELEEPS